MKGILQMVLGLAAMFSWSAAMAGDGAGKVIQLMAHTGDIVIFSLDGGHTGRPACSAPGTWALSLSTQSGRAMYALLLSAQSQGKQVSVHGTGACGAWGDREEPQYLWI